MLGALGPGLLGLGLKMAKSTRELQEVYHLNFNWPLILAARRLNSTEFPDASVVLGRIDYLSL